MAILNKPIYIILLHWKDTDDRKSVNEFRKSENHVLLLRPERQTISHLISASKEGNGTTETDTSNTYAVSFGQ